jgi:hypothetical protein
VAAAVAAAVAAVKECVVAVAANVAEDRERAVAATLGERVPVAAHCVASVVEPAGGRDSVVDACETVTRVDCDVCDHAFDLSFPFPFPFLFPFLSLSYRSLVRSRYTPQQRALAHRE